MRIQACPRRSCVNAILSVRNMRPSVGAPTLFQYPPRAIYGDNSTGQSHPRQLPPSPSTQAHRSTHTHTHTHTPPKRERERERTCSALSLNKRQCDSNKPPVSIYLRLYTVSINEMRQLRMLLLSMYANMRQHSTADDAHSPKFDREAQHSRAASASTQTSGNIIFGDKNARVKIELQLRLQLVCTRACQVRTLSVPVHTPALHGSGHRRSAEQRRCKHTRSCVRTQCARRPLECTHGVGMRVQRWPSGDVALPNWHF